MKWQWWLTVFLFWGTAFWFSGCSSPTITYQITGTADQAEIAYRDGRGDMVLTSVALPWEKTIRVKDGSQFELIANNPDQTGAITCAVWLNEQTVGSVSGVGFAECRGTVYVLTNGITANFKGRYDSVP